MEISNFWYPGMGISILWCPGMGIFVLWHPGMGIFILWSPGMGISNFWCPAMGISIHWSPGLGIFILWNPGMGISILVCPGMGISNFQSPESGISILWHSGSAQDSQSSSGHSWIPGSAQGRLEHPGTAGMGRDKGISKILPSRTIPGCHRNTTTLPSPSPNIPEGPEGSQTPPKAAAPPSGILSGSHGSSAASGAFLTGADGAGRNLGSLTGIISPPLPPTSFPVFSKYSSHPAFFSHPGRGGVGGGGG